MQKVLISLLLFPIMVNAQNPIEPKAKKIEKQLTIHNHTRTDNYYWMNERDSKDVLNYIKEENKVSHAFFKSQKSVIDNLMKEFDNRINPNEVYPPYKVNEITYQDTYSEGDDYIKTHIINLDGSKTLFIDENVRAKKKSFYELADWNPSPNNEIVAMCEDFVGRRKYTISFRKYASNEFLVDKLEGTDGSMEWSNDNKTIYYVKIDPQTLRSFQVYKHTLGTT